MFKTTFKGRVGRKDFFIGLFVSVVLMLIFRSLVDDFSGIFAIVFGIVTIVAVIWLLVFAISLYVRRLHDVGWSGWFALLTLVPLVNLGLFIVLVFMPGKTQQITHDDRPSESVNPAGPAAPMMQ